MVLTAIKPTTRTHEGKILGAHIGVYKPYYCLKTGITQQQWVLL